MLCCSGMLPGACWHVCRQLTACVGSLAAGAAQLGKALACLREEADAREVTSEDRHRSFITPGTSQDIWA